MLKILSLLNFLVALLVMLIITYLFGYELLEGALKGNDLGAVLTGTTWFDEWFPRLPRWYPLQNAGVSMVEGTYIGSYYLASLVKHFSFLSLAQSIRVVAFLSVFLTAVGIYIFVWVKFKSQTMALLAGVFYLLSQAVWSWITDIGIFAQSVSFMFFLPTVLAFDLYLNKTFNGEVDVRRKLFFVGSAAGVSLALLAHIMTGIVLLATLLLYAVFSFLFFKKGKIENLLSAIFAFTKVVLAGLMLISFWFLPFLRYETIASRSGIRALAPEQIPYVQIPIFLGLQGPDSLKAGNEMWYAFIALPIVVLAGIGLIIALVRRQKLVAILGLLAFFFLLFSALPGLWLGLVRHLVFGFLSNIYPRTFFVPMILLPVIASYGCFGSAQLLVKLAEKYLGFKIHVAKIFLTATLTLSFAFLALVFWRHVPANYETVACYGGYGLGRQTAIDYCSFWEKIGSIKPISKEGSPWEEPVRQLQSRLKLTDGRLDFSPSLGGMMSNWSAYSHFPLMSLYWYQVSLNDTFWAYQQATFYGKSSHGTAQEIDNLAKLFGINYVILNSDLDSPEVYSEDKWESLSIEKKDLVMPLEVKSLKKQASLATWDKKPAILVISRQDMKAYEQLLRVAVAGGINYDQAWLVEGKDNGKIDDYTLEELKNFDGLLLYGYTYQNKKRAWELLSQYVQEGGKLFVETGWQYVSPDWQGGSPAEVIPVKKLAWEQFNSWAFEGFAPPDYRGQPWGTSVASLSDLKDWAKPILVEKEKVLLAQGNYGKGKVVWSGMNLVGHSFIFKNKTERELLSTLISWLTVETKQEESLPVKMVRNYPDQVEFFLGGLSSQPTSLYFRETYFPDWKAIVQTTENGKQIRENLPIYRAGPNMMMVRMPPLNGEAEVILELKPQLVHYLSKILTILVLLFFLIWLFRERWLEDFSNRLLKHFTAKKAKSWWDKEDE